MLDDAKPGPFSAEDRTHIAGLADKTKRGLYVMALISEQLIGLKPVVVGGFAMEFYSTGGYRTSDIDALYLRPQEVGALLETLGFRRVNRHWVSETFDLQIEFPGHAIEQRAVDHRAGRWQGRHHDRGRGLDPRPSQRLHSWQFDRR